MVVAGLRLVNFRSYRDAAVRFGPRLNVIVGENATGKTNLLEGAWFALRGTSPRTRREDKLIAWGQRFARLELELEERAKATTSVAVGFAPGQAKRVHWGGLELTSLEDLRSRSQVFIFVPESLLLVKGGPARRRAHLDAFAAALDGQYAAAARDLQAALRQRNAQLAAVRQGADPSGLEPWDVQFARAAVELGRRRRDLVAALSERFAVVAAALEPDGGRYALRLVAQLEAVGYDEAELLRELASRRPGEVSRGLSLFGPHRDDLTFVQIAARPPAASPVVAGAPDAGASAPATSAAVELPRGGRDLRLFGSQGEQRAVVLALLLAEQSLAAERTGEQGPLFLDDVMSELDDARRRLLVRLLGTAGQAIITTTNRHYFSDDELASATVIELPLGGCVATAEVVVPADEDALAPPALDAL